MSINLELTDEEATILYLILSTVSMRSKVKTDGIFFKLQEIIDPDDDRVDISPKKCFEFAKGHRLVHDNILVIDGPL